MYVCNPWEPVGNTDYDAATQLIFNNDPADPNALQHRQMLTLRMDPGGSNNPGNFGFLVSPLSNGLNALREAIAKVQPQACFSKRGVTTQTGFGGQAIAQGFNVRFDIYEGSMNSNRNAAAYAPALNVRKGYIYTGGNACNADLDTRDPLGAVPMPPDTVPGTPVGNGVWDFDGYWSAEHPARSAPNGWSNTGTLPSRYSVYRYETDTAGVNADLSRGSPSGTAPQEDGPAHCNTNLPPASVDRRILFNAILNCQALTASGVLGGGSNSNIPVAAFGKFFLIHPIDRGASSVADINAEFVGTVKQSDNVSFNNYQLYR
jgi:hypothetical protein